MSAIFRKLLYFDDDCVQEKIEAVFGEIGNFSLKTWKDLVEIICDLASDMKKKFEENNANLVKENQKIREELACQKKQYFEGSCEGGSVSPNLREIYEKELKKYEEKVKFL